MTEAQPQVNNGQDRGVLHAMGDEETLVGQPAGRTARATAKLNGAGKVTDENPTLPPKDHNGGPAIDERAKPVNDIFAKIDKHDATGEHYRITVGRMLIALKAEIDKETPDTYRAKGVNGSTRVVKGSIAKSYHWHNWCAANVKRSKSDIGKVMAIAGADDPELALAEARASGAAKERGIRAASSHVRQQLDEEPAQLRKPLLETFGDGKPHLITHVAEKLGTTPERLAGHSRAPLKVMDEYSRNDVSKFVTALSPDGKKVTITPKAATVPVDEIEAKMRPFIEELKDWGRKTQIQISPHDILVAAERLEECIDLWAGRPSKFEKRKAERLARMHK